MEKELPKGTFFQYIDIDSIDNKTNIINKKMLSVDQAPSRASRKVFKESTLFSMVRPYLRNIAFVGEQNENAIASTGFYVCTPINGIHPKYLFLLLTSDYVVNELNEHMKGDNSPSIRSSDVENFWFPIPSYSYQIKVLSFLDKINLRIDEITRNEFEFKKLCHTFKSKILDYFFGKNSSYMSYYEKKYELGQILEYEQPTNYIVNSLDYNSEYSTPVLTAGKTFILGYTNEKCGIYHISKGEKVIIFDDFTTSSHLVDFDFKVKSSAMKILKIIDKKLFDIDYIYFLLQTLDIDTANHKRYWIQKYIPLQLKIHTYDEQKEIVKNIYKLYDVLDSICQS